MAVTLNVEGEEKILPFCVPERFLRLDSLLAAIKCQKRRTGIMARSRAGKAKQLSDNTLK